MYDGGRTHDLLTHNQALCQLSYIHHVVPIKGIEPNDIQDMSPDRKPFLSAFAEDIGIEPNTLTGTSRLAGGPYRHQGLLSIECGRTAVPWGSHTIYSPFCVHDGLRSHYLLCIRQVLYQLSYVNLLRTRQGTIL